MAEAHQAVAFSFAITHEGLHVNYDREILHIIWHSGLRSWTRSTRRILVSRDYLNSLLVVFIIL